VTVQKTEHHLFKLALLHLAVTDGKLRLGDESAQIVRHGPDGLDAVVDEKDLPSPAQFPQHRLQDQFV